MRKRITAIGVALLGACALLLLTAKIVHVAWNGERSGRTVSGWCSRWLAGRGGPAQQAIHLGRVDWPYWPALRSLFGGRPVRVEVSDFGLWDPAGQEVMAARRAPRDLSGPSVLRGPAKMKFS